MTQLTDQLVVILESVQTLIRTGCLWKMSSHLLPDLRLPSSFCHHDCNFCKKIKFREHQEKQCIKNDTLELAGLLATHKEIFAHTCHAGCVEIIYPINHNQNCLGAIMLGPFRRPACDCHYPDATDEYERLPEISDALLASLSAILPRLFRDLIIKGYAARFDLLERNSEEPRIRLLLEFLKANYQRDIPLKMAAEKIHLSPSRFSHFFKQECGLNYSDYLLRLRIHESCVFLLGSELQVGEIALQCGFSSQTHFSTMFKKVIGTAPITFRRNNRPKNTL